MAQRNRTCRGLSLSPLALGRWWLFGSAIVFSCYILSHSCQMSRQGAGKPLAFWVYRCTKSVLALVYPSRSCSNCFHRPRVMSDSDFPMVHLSNAFYAQGAGCSPPPAVRLRHIVRPHLALTHYRLVSIFHSLREYLHFSHENPHFKVAMFPFLPQIFQTNN